MGKILKRFWQFDISDEVHFFLDRLMAESDISFFKIKIQTVQINPYLFYNFM